MIGSFTELRSWLPEDGQWRLARVTNWHGVVGRI
jgi:hypothetical protein